MPIASFGIYAAVIIMVCYFLIILMMPPMIIWYEEKLVGKWCPCSKNERTTTTKISYFKDLTDGPEEIGKVEAFFSGPMNRFVVKFRWFIIVFFTLWTAGSAYLASQLSPLTEQE
jgi:hypothetical protein